MLLANTREGLLMLIDLNFVVQVYKWASSTKQFNSLANKVKLKNMFWENGLKQASWVVFLCSVIQNECVLMLQLNIVKSYMN